MQKREYILFLLLLAAVISIIVCTVIGPEGIPFLGLADDESASIILFSVVVLTVIHDILVDT